LIIVKNAGPFIPDPDCPSSGSYLNTWTATDSCGNTSEIYTQTITIDPAPIAAWVNPPVDITISCDDALTFVATNLDYTNNETGACEIAGTELGVITGSFDECLGTLIQTWTFVDDCGRQIQHVQTITIEPAPIAAWVNPPVDITISCDDALTFVATNLDYTNNETGACEIAGTELGVITGSFDECLGTLIQTWTFVDDCGL